MIRAWKTVLVLALCLALLASCGPSVKLITTPAKDMNLKAEQIGTGYTQSEEQGLEQFASSLSITDTKDVSDANYRMFQDQSGDVALSLVITLNKQATAADLKDLTSGFEEGFTKSISGTTLTQYTAPAVGDEATVRGTTFPDLGMSIYFMGFRKVNVIGVLAVVGTGDTANEKVIGDLGQKLAGQIK
jgi:hypothetical protein